MSEWNECTAAFKTTTKIECFHTNSHDICKSLREKYVCSFIYIALSCAGDTWVEKIVVKIVVAFFFLNNFPPRNVNARFTFISNTHKQTFAPAIIFSSIDFCGFILGRRSTHILHLTLHALKMRPETFLLMICLLFHFEIELMIGMNLSWLFPVSWCNVSIVDCRWWWWWWWSFPLILLHYKLFWCFTIFE